MASLDVAQRQTKDALPPIANLDFEKYRFDPIDSSRYTMPGINRFGTTMSSPPTAYSAPPPPYTSGVSSNQSMSGYISPPESSSRRSTRDEKESPKGTNSLPSISEALKSADMPPVSAQSYTPVSAPGSTVAQTFTEAPKGPGNPFSQPVAPASALRSSFSSGTEPPSISTLPPPPVPPDAKSAPLNTTSSPSSSLSAHKLSGPFPSASGQLEPHFRSSFSSDGSQRGYPYPDYSLSHLPTSSAKFHFEPQSKLEDSQRTFAKSESRPYTETIKRHLDIYDAELALSELAESSAHSLEFAKIWSQRYHQSNRASYITDGLPNTAEVDDMLRNAHRMIESLSQLREVSIMQQNALNEQRARLAQGQHHEDDFHRLGDDFKVGGFAGGDAKKRRGKAAPPGRCHSCNRAETPEWRRGPDGARTLCNACGLHYAKLTRKMGANKAAVLTGSNLRPKGLNETRP